jgi:hypothetical protein
MMSSIFTAYLQQTRTVVLYRLPGTIRPCALFPYATTVALVDCAPQAVERMLDFRIFPKLQNIHYLSGHPGRVDIHRAVTGCSWVFPRHEYLFYQTMIEGGWGRADGRLIPTYVDRVHGGGMDLRLPIIGVYPGMSGYIRGDYTQLVTGYHWHLMEFLHTPHRPVQGVLSDAFEEVETRVKGSHQEWRETQLEREVMEAVHRQKV